ncbi:tryptophan-rich sensory protein [Rossellomorea vietnamensis]|uniref:Tryptophan-rich sensory protein n=1 Tax=Rossellomorea vietnamensis TaxID=218284 RepID=A0A5D4NQ16_9BACI|nr:tryptophan-rich sensory protein [Rossellomorea vietnamensis]TYS14992.1 tryptophan-rich sensory protein [Rossellomorea vietnamensis]
MGRLLLNIAAFILVVVVNALAVTLPLNGQTTGEISNRLDVFFTPAGYVFSIWSVIYLLLGIWIIQQIPKKNRESDYYRTLSPYFIATCLLNSTWIFMWHYNYFGLSVIVMLSLLITLILLYRKAEDLSNGFLDMLPFSVYLGWISVAAVANISYYLTFLEWGGFGLGEAFWAIFLLAFSLALAVYFRIKKRDWIYPLVFVWATIGIGVNNQSEHPILSSLSYAVAVLIFLAVMFFRGYKQT